MSRQEFPVFSRYVITHRLGQGGMGSVYVAIQKGLDRNVALKVPDYHPDKSFLKRFEREGKTLGNLSHPNVVKVFDAAIENDQAYIAMELIDGENLEERILSNPPSIEQTIQWGRQLADALDYIHSRQIIHRDVKTLNIIIDSRDQPVLVDFGIVKVSTLTQLTRNEQDFLGTPYYASPESIDRKTLTSKSDLYSLGVVLYRCLTHTYPYDANSVPAFIHAVLNTNHTPAHQVNPEVPAWLSDIIDRCLEKNPENRMPSAAALRDALLDAEPAARSSRFRETAAFTSTHILDERNERRKGQSTHKVRTPKTKNGTGFSSRKAVLSGLAFIVLAGILYILSTSFSGSVNGSLDQPVNASGAPLDQIDSTDTLPDPSARTNTSDTSQDPSSEQILVENVPAPITSLMRITDVDELGRQLVQYRSDAVLTYSQNTAGFRDPGACYVIVYNEEGVVTILNPEDSNGQRVNLQTQEQLSGPFETAFSNADFVWVLIL